MPREDEHVEIAGGRRVCLENSWRMSNHEIAVRLPSRSESKHVLLERRRLARPPVCVRKCSRAATNAACTAIASGAWSAILFDRREPGTQHVEPRIQWTGIEKPIQPAAHAVEHGEQSCRAALRRRSES
jgi:hypothetical protein